MSLEIPGLGQVDTLVCDIDGVMLIGPEPIPGALQALTQVRAAGIEIVLATNNSSRRPETARRNVIDVVGFDPGVDAVVNSGAATAEYIAELVETVFVLGTDELRDTLRARGVRVTSDWTKADAVVAGIDPTATYSDLAQAGLAIQNGATFYATNTDASYPQPDGLYPGAGALVAAVATTTGREPIVCGKPHPPMRKALARRAGAYPVIIGDRPETDIAMGKAEGWPTILPLTGVIRDPGMIPPDLTPDLVIASIADLPDLFGL